MGKLSDSFKGFGSDLLNRLREDHFEKLEEAAFEERIIGIEKATDAFLEAGISDDVIVQLLQKYWDLRLSEATEVLCQKKHKV